eukprot:m.109502 g.109502  ORF g.109502 m.109502 type:complete len:53 (-) comp12848_c0_seq2:55-213(-)
MVWSQLQSQIGMQQKSFIISSFNRFAKVSREFVKDAEGMIKERSSGLVSSKG